MLRISATKFVFIYLFAGSYACASTLPSNTPDLLPLRLDNYANIELPEHFLTPELQARDNTPSDNLTTDEGATLGRVLFYDKKLSKNNTISCGSCHIQKNGFSNEKKFGVGINGQKTFTKTLPLDNLRYRSSFGIDPPNFGGDTSSTLEEQALIAITSPREMGQISILDAISTIENQPYYSRLFANAFGDSAITQDRVAKALSQFMRSMLSFNSRFDRGMASDFANFTLEEKEGRTLFNSDRTNCSKCHQPEQLHQNSNSGAIGVNTATSMSRGSLRNVNERKFFTAFSDKETLKDMLTHYNKNVSRCVNGTVVPTASGERFPFGRFDCDLGNELSVDFPSGTGIKMELSEEEENAIISYLKTLSDPLSESSVDASGNIVFHENSLLFESKYSDPFFKRTLLNHERGKLIVPSMMLLLEE